MLSGGREIRESGMETTHADRGDPKVGGGGRRTSRATTHLSGCYRGQ